MKGFIETLPTIEADARNIVVIDDQMSQAGKLETSNIFTNGSHHRNITVFYIVQNGLDMGYVHRTISLNSPTMVLFKNPREEGQMKSLAQHVLPTKVNFLTDSFREASKKEHGSLLLDLPPLTSDAARVRTSIFNTEEVEIFAPASEAKEFSVDLDSSRYITRVE